MIPFSGTASLGSHPSLLCTVSSSCLAIPPEPTQWGVPGHPKNSGKALGLGVGAAQASPWREVPVGAERMRRSWGRGAWKVVTPGSRLRGGPVGRATLAVWGFPTTSGGTEGRGQQKQCPPTLAPGREAGPSPGSLPNRWASLEAARALKCQLGQRVLIQSADG